MKQISVNTAGTNYDVFVACPLKQLHSYFKVSSGIIISEQRLYGKTESASLGLPIKTLSGGEGIKSLRVIEELYSSFLDAGIDKSSVIIAVGGGALTDVVAFAASTFHRGIPCITVPSTLLAQVDASIGGKNGINFGGVKNLVGTIVQPRLVICDLDFLGTLPVNEISNGIAEIIKAAVIADSGLLKLLEDSSRQVFGLNENVLEEIVSRAVQVKADIVTRDERESHERMKLNFGHTIGHALEVSCNLSHGEAVAIGMLLETKMAVQLGLCHEDLVERLQTICRLYNLPTEIDFDAEDITIRMLQDKKRRSEQLNFALPHRLEKVEITAIKADEIKKILSNLRCA